MWIRSCGERHSPPLHHGARGSKPGDLIAPVRDGVERLRRTGIVADEDY
ncbi:MAG TPA: hypothetical protein VN715_08345 [Roseiarcus sp.]|nr:hypothetical protein [Roseiarcus sp.]